MPPMVRFLLELLEEVTGLKVNFNKSILVGVSLEDKIMWRAASVLGIPKEVAKRIEAIHCRFFWHASRDKCRGWQDVAWGRLTTNPLMSISRVADPSLPGMVWSPIFRRNVTTWRAQSRQRKQLEAAGR
ncbi:hypothetical protein Taro_046649 [Colocasia esculenta]|uniref:Uncharacterized protein n=1 Tax=Colocasia esculenta TaxID=4460 RepID=A0A843WZB3_COLES|nr:hypothetical protein [Colocasia esculenta]